MKVLFPTTSFFPAQVGGPNNTLLWHTDWLNNNGFEPVIVTTTKSIDNPVLLPPNVWLEKDFGKIIYLKEQFSVFPFQLIFTCLGLFRKVDVIHFNSLFSSATIYLIFFAALCKRKIVASPRGELFASAINRKNFKKKLVLFLYKAIKNRLVFHCTSEEEKQTIISHVGNVKIHMQYNFILAQYHEKPIHSEKNFVFLGRINPIKNIDILLRAAQKSLQFMSSSSKIIIAGEARLEYEKQYYQSIQQWISEHSFEKKVEFVGYVNGHEKTALFNRAYFLVLPSKSENFGNAIVEALCHHTPVIASTGTPWQILENENAGFWTSCNEETLSLTIDKALTLPESTYIAMSENAANLVRKTFDVTSPNNHWIEIYKTIANET